MDSGLHNKRIYSQSTYFHSHISHTFTQTWHFHVPRFSEVWWDRLDPQRPHPVSPVLFHQSPLHSSFQYFTKFFLNPTVYSSLLYVCSIPFPILPSFSFFPFFKNFHVGVIVDSHAVVRNHKEGSLVPFTKYLPMETSRKAMVQHHNQDTDIGRTH